MPYFAIIPLIRPPPSPTITYLSVPFLALLKPPSISIVLRGYEDRFGFQRRFLRSSWYYPTNYIVLSWKLLPKDWNPVTQSVKSCATPGGETSVVVNGDLAKTMNKAYSVVAELIANDLPSTALEAGGRPGRKSLSLLIHVIVPQ